MMANSGKANRKETAPIGKVEVTASKRGNDDSFTSIGGTTGSGTTVNSTTPSRSTTRVEAKFRKKFDANTNLQVELACPTLKNYSTGKLLDVEQLAGALVRYCKIVDNHANLTLHSPVSVLQALLEVLQDSTVCNMLIGAISDAFYALDAGTQALFTPLMTKPKDSSSNSSKSDVINRRKLIALHSGQNPVQKLRLQSQKLYFCTTHNTRTFSTRK